MISNLLHINFDKCSPRNRPMTKRNGAKKHKLIDSKTLESDQAVPEKSGIKNTLSTVMISRMAEALWV